MYQLTANPQIVVRLEDGAAIPLTDPDLGVFRDYQAWIDAGGVPAPYAPTFDQKAALQRARDMRKPILDAVVGIGLQAMFAGDAATTAACMTARQGLLDITKDAGVLAATNDDAFDAAVLLRYRQLVAVAPAVVRAAFVESAT